jgi:hypothetical protein
MCKNFPWFGEMLMAGMSASSNDRSAAIKASSWVTKKSQMYLSTDSKILLSMQTMLFITYNFMKILQIRK